MRRMNTERSMTVRVGKRELTRIGLIALTGMLGLMLTATSAWAAPANFDSVFGFEAAGLEGLESISIDVEDPFLGAGEGGGGSLDVELSGSQDVCILAGDNICRATTAGLTTGYSVLVTVEVTAVNAPAIDGEFTLFLSGLFGTTYSSSEVFVELDPTAPAGLDTSAVPNFTFSGSFDNPIRRVIDTSVAGTTYNYIGWTVALGDSVSFRYEVTAPPNGRTIPQLMANATTQSIPIPEPGTALLMGLGLLGLASVPPRKA